MNFYHLVILDASGSMQCIRKTALAGCNETIQSIVGTQKKQPGNAHFLSLVLFDSENSTNILFDKTPINEAKELLANDYVPNACTPLYDCIGYSVTHLSNTTMDVKDKSYLVTIITDGEENSSIVFTAEKVKNLVEELKPQGWTFALIGANIDEVLTGKNLGIHNTYCWQQDEKGTKEMFKDLDDARVMFSICAPKMSARERDTQFFKKKSKK